MNIKQIRSDYENGTLICRETWAELLTFAEQADAVIAGRQQAIGELNMRVAHLEANNATYSTCIRELEKSLADSERENAVKDLRIAQLEQKCILYEASLKATDVAIAAVEGATK